MEIYVGSIPFKWKEKNIEELFAPYAAVSNATIIIDKITRQNKGFGFVTIIDESSAYQAIEALNGREVEGRILKVSESKPKQQGEGTKRNDKKSQIDSKSKMHVKPKKKLPPWLRKEY